ncbi:hypothetical protein PCI56_03370 [Plesiomonas shigelloides subsp. oncorhynchi]|nr:hypothetical protein [Plesiomonas shigelloides]
MAQALDAIVQHGGFDKGPSDVYHAINHSQRIKQLEKWLAQPVLIRETPPKPTAIGRHLLGFYRQGTANGI